MKGALRTRVLLSCLHVRSLTQADGFRHRHLGKIYQYNVGADGLWASLVAQQERIHLQCRRRGFDPWVGKFPLEEGMATHSSIPAWKIPWTAQPGSGQCMRLQRGRYNWSAGHTRTYCGFADRPGTQSREPGRSGRPRLQQQGQRASHSQGCSPRPPRAVSKFIHSPQWVRAWTQSEWSQPHGTLQGCIPERGPLGGPWGQNPLPGDRGGVRRLRSLGSPRAAGGLPCSHSLCDMMTSSTHIPDPAATPRIHFHMCQGPGGKVFWHDLLWNVGNNLHASHSLWDW